MELKGVSGIYIISGVGRNYVGSAVCIHKRWNVHRSTLRAGTHRNIHLQRAWDKHGESAFHFSVLEIVQDKNLLIEREQYWIDSTADLYNLNPIAGSQLGAKRSKETLKLMSDIRKGVRPSDDCIAAVRKYHTGRKQSVNTCKRRGDTLRGRKREFTEEHKAAISAGQTGKTRVFTEEHRLALSIAKTGSKQSDEVKKKISEANKGKKRTFTEEHKAAIKASWEVRKKQ